MVSIRGVIKYGQKQIEVDIDTPLDKRITILTGPNLTGKSLVLKCIYTHAKRAIGRIAQEDIKHMLGDLNCQVDRKIDVAIYVDAYRTSIQLYEYITEEFSRIKTDLRRLEKWGEAPVNAGELVESLEKIEDSIKADAALGVSAKKLTDDSLVVDAYRVLDQLREEYGKAARSYQLFDDFFPLRISASEKGLTWTDLKTGAEGRSLLTLSTVFSPALVAMYTIYAYAASRHDDVYLLVEEPEAHAHPTLAHFLGRLAQRLAERAEEQGLGFRAVYSTHSLDFVLGAYGEHTNVYILRRTQDKIYSEKEKWDGKKPIPGLTHPGAYDVFVKRSAKEQGQRGPGHPLRHG
ncbi:MAG: hypothetical protein ACPL3C_03655 [Pyrobaculum sp.]